MTTDSSGVPLTAALQPLSADDPHEVGGYPLHARLGAGGMGRVYLSYTPGGRPVALKVVRPEFAEDAEFRQRFAQEVASAQRIHGLYTAQVIDSGLDAATPWLATAYVPGPSLQQVVREHGVLPVRTVLLLVGGIAEALQAIHRVEVVHRDLKPANVLIAADGPRVIDFGIARAADATMLTSPDLRIGSPPFMAPEQAESGTATPATDVWALGALAAFVAGGIPPFGEGLDPAVLYRVVHQEPDLSRVPAELHELVLRCLAKDPDRRPLTSEIIEAARTHPLVGGPLRFTGDWLPSSISSEISRRAEQPTQVLVPPQPTVLDRRPVGPTRRRASRRTLVAIAAVTLLAGTAGGAVLLGQLGRQDTGATAGAQDTPSASQPASPGDGYTAVYTATELTAPDNTYSFDIRTGKVVPEESTKWSVGHGTTEFYIPDGSDAFLAPDDQLTPADCIKGVDSGPVNELKFTDASVGRSFCLRARDSREIAIVRVLAVDQSNGPVKVSMDYYRPG